MGFPRVAISAIRWALTVPAFAMGFGIPCRILNPAIQGFYAAFDAAPLSWGSFRGLLWGLTLNAGTTIGASYLAVRCVQWVAPTHKKPAGAWAAKIAAGALVAYSMFAVLLWMLEKCPFVLLVEILFAAVPAAFAGVYFSRWPLPIPVVDPTKAPATEVGS